MRICAAVTLHCIVHMRDSGRIQGYGSVHCPDRMEKKLKKAQRQLSKKKKGSVKWNKARKKVAKINRKIERQRDDFSHKTSNNLVRDHDLIVFEDLNITGMDLCMNMRISPIFDNHT